ncbi:hypothetical protein AB0J72_56610 [Dactylosporangium sp. NPDC049742]|uniref:hypothetical protein n=1 Tax=Dactylosporangium sp. NPDC049742 TaxID=3154737 RepID=UPI00343FA4DA
MLLVPCTRSGKVDEDARPVAGSAEIVTEPAKMARMTELVRRKYGLAYRVLMLIERIVVRGARDRIMLRITLSA